MLLRDVVRSYRLRLCVFNNISDLQRIAVQRWVYFCFVKGLSAYEPYRSAKLSYGDGKELQTF